METRTTVTTQERLNARRRVTHNPDASEDERLRFRETFNVRDHLAGQPPPVQQQAPIQISRDQVIQLARVYGLEIIAQSAPGMGGGRMQSLEEKAAKVDALTEENTALRSKVQKLVARINLMENKSEAT